MNGWMLFWKIVLIAGVLVFAGMTIWVTIWGYYDIKHLLKKMKEDDDKT